MENQNDLIVKFDPDYKINFVNPIFCRTYGKTEEELTNAVRGLTSFLAIINDGVEFAEYVEQKIRDK